MRFSCHKFRLQKKIQLFADWKCFTKISKEVLSLGVWFEISHHWFRLWLGANWAWPCDQQDLSGLILGLRPTDERRRYFVTTSLIGWAQTWNRPWSMFLVWHIMNCQVCCQDEHICCLVSTECACHSLSLIVMGPPLRNTNNGVLAGNLYINMMTEWQHPMWSISCLMQLDFKSFFMSKDVDNLKQRFEHKCCLQF